MNKVILLGNLVFGNEIKESRSGLKYLKNSIAVNRRFKGQNGEVKDETMFIDLTFWGRTAETTNQYFRKGSKILVEGRLVQEQWTAEDGSKKSKHSVSVDNVIFVEPKKQGDEDITQKPSQPPKQNRFTAPVNSKPVLKRAPEPIEDDSADYYIEDGENDRLPF